MSLFGRMWRSCGRGQTETTSRRSGRELEQCSEAYYDVIGLSAVQRAHIQASCNDIRPSQEEHEY
jgi:hypothetical protein